MYDWVCAWVPVLQIHPKSWWQVSHPKECPDALDLPVQKSHKKKEHFISELSHSGIL